MLVVADANIACVQDAFGNLGDVSLVPGRRIDREAVRGASAIFVRSITKVGRDLLEGSDVRFVGTATIGTDHVDTEYLRDREIEFASAPGANATAAAQYVISSLLHFSRRANVQLAGKTIGIVGVGNIGSRVRRYAELLGMTCLLNDPPKCRESGNGEFLGLGDVLGEADFVTVHVPLTRDGTDPTLRLVDEGFLGKMKNGAVFVNMSRGEVVVEDALRGHRGRLGGIILDVWGGEPLIDMRTLQAADIATPHIAGYALDGRVRATDMIYRAACAHFCVARTWAGVPTAPDPEPVDLRGAADPLFTAIDVACPVMRDDELLRRMFDTPAEKRGAYFDSLRAGYPLRREFDKYSLICRDDDCCRLTRSLGFAVRTEA